MTLAWALLIALSAADAGLPLPLPEPAAEPPVECKPPGYWDPGMKQCRPGCGIPTRWENGVQVGGCGKHDKRTDVELPKPEPKPDEPRAACAPPGYWDSKLKQCMPGCGIPIRWVNGRQVGGCGRKNETRPPIEETPLNLNPPPKP